MLIVANCQLTPPLAEESVQHFGDQTPQSETENHGPEIKSVSIMESSAFGNNLQFPFERWPFAMANY